MSRFAAGATAAVGAGGTLSAIFLVPWAHSGDVDLELGRFPMWSWYVGAAAVLHLCVAGHVVARGVGLRRALLAAALLAVAATVIAATAVMLRYDDLAALLNTTDFVRPVAPAPGFGGPVAVVAAAVTAVALTGEPRRSHREP